MVKNREAKKRPESDAKAALELLSHLKKWSLFFWQPEVAGFKKPTKNQPRKPAKNRNVNHPNVCRNLLYSTVELREQIIQWFCNLNFRVDDIVLLSGRSQTTVHQIVHLYDTFGQVTNPHATSDLCTGSCTVLKFGFDCRSPPGSSQTVKEYWALKLADN
jgi:hypothetical protein